MCEPLILSTPLSSQYMSDASGLTRLTRQLISISVSDSIASGRPDMVIAFSLGGTGKSETKPRFHKIQFDLED